MPKTTKQFEILHKIYDYPNLPKYDELLDDLTDLCNISVLDTQLMSISILNQLDVKLNAIETDYRIDENVMQDLKHISLMLKLLWGYKYE
jgi:hypothetical protein